MGYVGTPIDTRNQFQSLVGKRFSGDGSETEFTLDVAPGNVLDIEVFVGNVRQDPNSAYTLSGTTLTFTGAPPSGTNNIYVVHQAKSVGTIDVPAGGVAAGSLATSVLTGQTDIGAAIADADLFLIDDGAGGTLRKTAASRIKTYIGDNTPAVLVTNSGNQSIGNSSNTLATFDTETVDTDSAFASNTFTVPSGEGGMYFISFRGSMTGIDAGEFIQLRIYLNDSAVDFFENRMTAYTDNVEFKFSGSGSLNLSAGDTIKYYVFQNSGDSQNLTNAGLYIFKLVGV